MLVRVRAFEPGQRRRVQAFRMHVLEGDRFSDAEFDAAMHELRTRAPRLYLHIDLDPLDPAEGIANHYRTPGGLSSAGLALAIAEAFRQFDVAAAAITAYDPGGGPRREDARHRGCGRSASSRAARSASRQASRARARPPLRLSRGAGGRGPNRCRSVGAIAPLSRHRCAARVVGVLLCVVTAGCAILVCSHRRPSRSGIL
jgi:hypothetical protein